MEERRWTFLDIFGRFWTFLDKKWTFLGKSADVFGFPLDFHFIFVPLSYRSPIVPLSLSYRCPIDVLFPPYFSPNVRLFAMGKR